MSWATRTVMYDNVNTGDIHRRLDESIFPYRHTCTCVTAKETEAVCETDNGPRNEPNFIPFDKFVFYAMVEKCFIQIVPEKRPKYKYAH